MYPSPSRAVTARKNSDQPDLVLLRHERQIIHVVEIDLGPGLLRKRRSPAALNNELSWDMILITALYYNM
jgi:hypothetical protein